jgi:hypothetical protein
MWFTIHLRRKGLVSSDQLIDAIEEQCRRRTPIGRLAVQSRKLSVAQVSQILKVQADRPKPFGRLAVELGYLTESELAELLMLQSDRDRPISDILVERGAITRERLEAERTYFRQGVVSTPETPALDASADLLPERCAPRKEQALAGAQ